MYLSLFFFQAKWNYNCRTDVAYVFISEAVVRASDKIELTLDALRDYSAMISAQNKKAAFKYLDYIEDVLNNLTTYWVRRMNEIFACTQVSIEFELRRYDDMMQKEYQDVIDRIRAKLTSIQKMISSSSQPTDDFVKLQHQTNHSIATILATVDDLYILSSAFLVNLVTREAQNTVDRISRTFLSNHIPSYQYVASEQIDFCGNISEQNSKIEKVLKTLARAINIESVIEIDANSAEAEFEKKQDLYRFADSAEKFHTAPTDSQRLLQSTLENGSYYLGSLIRVTSEQRRHKVNDFITKSYRTSINSFVMALDRITVNLEVIKENNPFRTIVDTLLNSLDEIIRPPANQQYTRGKRISINSNGWGDLKQNVQKKFESMTRAYSDAFRTKKVELFDTLKIKLENIVVRSKVYASSLSIQNYLLTDTCPLAADYQRFKVMEMYNII